MITKKGYPSNFGELSYSAENKAQFLAESRKLLTAVGNQLKAQGLCDSTNVSVNPAGIAVGGDAYGYFNDEFGGYGILVTITHSCVGHGRRDGVVCYIQQRGPDRQPRKVKGGTHYGQIYGANSYVSDIEVASITEAATKSLQHHPLKVRKELAACTQSQSV